MPVREIRTCRFEFSIACCELSFDDDVVRAFAAHRTLNVFAEHIEAASALGALEVRLLAFLGVAPGRFLVLRDVIEKLIEIDCRVPLRSREYRLSERLEEPSLVRRNEFDRFGRAPAVRTERREGDSR